MVGGVFNFLLVVVLTNRYKGGYKRGVGLGSRLRPDTKGDTKGNKGNEKGGVTKQRKGTNVTTVKESKPRKHSKGRSHRREAKERKQRQDLSFLDMKIQTWEPTGVTHQQPAVQRSFCARMTAEH